MISRLAALAIIGLLTSTSQAADTLWTRTFSGAAGMRDDAGALAVEQGAPTVAGSIGGYAFVAGLDSVGDTLWLVDSLNRGQFKRVGTGPQSDIVVAGWIWTDSGDSAGTCTFDMQSADGTVMWADTMWTNYYSLQSLEVGSSSDSMATPALACGQGIRSLRSEQPPRTYATMNVSQIDANIGLQQGEM